MADLYPETPGAKGLTGATFDASADAAEAMAHCVNHLRMIALRALYALHEATVLECVAVTDYPRESLQPRFSELIRLGLIKPTGARRRNPSGKSAAVLCLTTKGRDAVKGGGHD
ncbi:MAG: hypothetical protein P4M15_06120 [Alphaproteobacteria bacterium]|nr:hypothetical protein [Alphaproteobacteria bacterium]